jgi:glycosyltransferase involved in cell wall biosynthesis
MGLKILIVTAMYPHAGREGYGAFVRQQVEAVKNLGHTVEVLDFRGYLSKLQYLKGAFEVYRRTRQNYYDIVHAHYGLAGLPALFRGRAPLVVSLHGSDALIGKLEPWISRFVCRRADATIVVSAKIAAKIPGVVIPCGVDLDVFKPIPRARARERLKLANDRKYVLFPFSPARHVKRFDLAQSAVGQLASQGMAIELLTISNVPNQEMPWYYNAADAMILCSDSEGSPTSMKESLACNLPVVSVDVGDVREIVSGIKGVEIVDQTAPALAHGLRTVLKAPPGSPFQGRQAMQRYSQTQIAESIVRVYREVLDQRKHASITGMKANRACQGSQSKTVDNPGC